jgi:hypothetical protein
MREHFVVREFCLPSTILDSGPEISTNKTGRHEITEILLKVALNTILPLSNLNFLLRINNINNIEKLIIIRNNINE